MTKRERKYLAHKANERLKRRILKVCDEIERLHREIWPWDYK